ncbi:MAG: TIGR01459 family HAD-type hydrolase [Magnetococcales bacterium]|nr:TIGR01459 family HAD-type hydrolase [Magnetococcales bacterium]
MDYKPKITDKKQLVMAAGQIRNRFILSQPGLDERLVSAAMARCEFYELIQQFDLIMFDAYGVLNRGGEKIAGSPEAVSRCHQLGVPVLVVSNNASEGPQQVCKKLGRMGFEFKSEQIITSGLAVKPFIQNSPLHNHPYLLIGTRQSADCYGPDPQTLLVNPPDGPVKSDLKPSYVLICSNRDYYGGPQQQEVEKWLTKRALPLVVANPDQVVPDERGQPVVVAGYTASRLAEQFGGEIVGIGKPYSPVYQLALQNSSHIPRRKILMVGDSLTTDILGGAALGISTCLTLSGLHGQEVEPIEDLCRNWAIQPDYIVPQIGPS